MDNRFIIGRDFNTKDWWIYDDKRDFVVCWCDTEKEAQEIADELNRGFARTPYLKGYLKGE